MNIQYPNLNEHYKICEHKYIMCDLCNYQVPLNILEEHKKSHKEYHIGMRVDVEVSDTFSYLELNAIKSVHKKEKVYDRGEIIHIVDNLILVRCKCRNRDITIDITKTPEKIQPYKSKLWIDVGDKFLGGEVDHKKKTIKNTYPSHIKIENFDNEKVTVLFTKNNEYDKESYFLPLGGLLFCSD